MIRKLFALFAALSLLAPTPAIASVDPVARGMAAKALTNAAAAQTTANNAASATAPGTKTLIASKTWDGTTTVFTFSSIPGSYAGGLVLECAGAGAGGAATMTFNGDTAAHYQWQLSGAQNATLAVQTLTASNIQIMPAFAATFDMVIRFQNYASGAQKRVAYVSSTGGNNGTGSLAVAQTAGIWDNSTLSNAAITSFTITFNTAPATSSGPCRLFGVN